MQIALTFVSVLQSAFIFFDSFLVLFYVIDRFPLCCRVIRRYYFLIFLIIHLMANQRITRPTMPMMANLM